MYEHVFFQWSKYIVTEKKKIIKTQEVLTDQCKRLVDTVHVSVFTRKKTNFMGTDASKKKLYFSSQKYIILFQGILTKRNYEITGNFTRKSGDKMATSHVGLIISYFVCRGSFKSFSHILCRLKNM